MPRHHVEMCAVGTSWALTGIMPVLPPQFVMLQTQSIKPKAQVIGYPSFHYPEAGKASHAIDTPKVA